MTLKEAIKILKKEFLGIRFKKFNKPLKFEEKLWVRNEKPEILEALRIVAKNGISVCVPVAALRIRSIITKKMMAGEESPSPVSGTPLSAAEGIKLQWKDNKNTVKNPSLKETASQFNDALLDEQVKKIKRFGKEIARLNNIIRKKNLKIAEKDEVIDNLGKELAEKYKELTSKEKEINELLFKFEGARSFLLRSQRENEEKCKTEESLLKRIDEMELMLKQREGMLRLSDTGNDLKDAMLDRISKSYDKSQKRIAEFTYKSLSKSKELGNGLVERMEPIRRKRKKTKKYISDIWQY